MNQCCYRVVHTIRYNVLIALSAMSSATTHLAYTKNEGNGNHRQKFRPLLPLDASVYAFEGVFCAYAMSTLYPKVIVLAQYIRRRNAITIGHQLSKEVEVEPISKIHVL